KSASPRDERHATGTGSAVLHDRALDRLIEGDLGDLDAYRIGKRDVVWGSPRRAPGPCLAGAASADPAACAVCSASTTSTLCPLARLGGTPEPKVIGARHRVARREGKRAGHQHYRRAPMASAPVDQQVRPMDPALSTALQGAVGLHAADCVHAQNM